MDVLTKSTKHRQSTQIIQFFFFCKNKKLPGIENRNEKDNFKLGTLGTSQGSFFCKKTRLWQETFARRTSKNELRGERIKTESFDCWLLSMSFGFFCDLTSAEWYVHACSKACLFVHRLPDWLGGIKIPCTTCTQNHSHRDASTKKQWVRVSAYMWRWKQSLNHTNWIHQFRVKQAEVKIDLGVTRGGRSINLAAIQGDFKHSRQRVCALTGWTVDRPVWAA